MEQTVSAAPWVETTAPARAVAARRTYVSSLTPLRGLAALWIVLFHFNEIVPIVQPAWTGIVRRSYVTVDYFFIMSGFVICHAYGRQLAADRSWPTIASYVRARFARIYPLHFLWLCIHVLLFLAASRFAPPVLSESDGFKQLYNVNAIPSHLTMLHAIGFHDHRTWNGPSWSIAAEWWTYMVAIPLFAWVLSGSRWRVISVAVASLCGFLALEIGGGQGTINFSWDYGFVRCLLGFCLGVALHQVFHLRTVASWFERDVTFLATYLAGAVLLHVEVDDVVMIPVLGVMVLAGAHNRGWIMRVLETRPLRYLGDISYSIYLCQSLALMLIMVPFTVITGLLSGKPQLPGLGGLALWYLALYLLVLSMASVTYRWVEVPARRWIHARFDAAA